MFLYKNNNYSQYDINWRILREIKKNLTKCGVKVGDMKMERTGEHLRIFLAIYNVNCNIKSSAN